METSYSLNTEESTITGVATAANQVIQINEGTSTNNKLDTIIAALGSPSDGGDIIDLLLLLVDGIAVQSKQDDQIAQGLLLVNRPKASNLTINFEVGISVPAVLGLEAAYLAANPNLFLVSRTMLYDGTNYSSVCYFSNT
jgi:hypothetical protein